MLANLDLERCPHCNINKPNLQRINLYQTISSDHRIRRDWVNYQCSRCGGIVLGEGRTGVRTPNEKTFIEAIYPDNSLTLSDFIPVRAKEYLKQAIDSIVAPSGSIVLSASSVDAMLKSKEYKDGSLYSRIDQAAKDHLITKEMANWAHEIRLHSNEERHSDEEQELPNEEEAKKCIEFALALAEFLFVLPSRIEKGRNTKGEKPN
ncbi:DUF4145 domain-containing protein [Leptospira langatensis]|uniref:DUF4145 domain-containing protein n=1 Tax=Leptospira langatensis TaxID=2484983 RepID=A0A5F1ZS14_9LEPT|nr:DUF4145 domain-containing protein [Leptospira langatensis]TGK01802.1 DUF4145 domain-containing protein [Leptospira langatensis]TGL39538.1 DUF4145 domain-containing protein [Leptospira langatensis]